MVKSLADYLSEVGKLISTLKMSKVTTTPWFRGHAKQNWSLTPSIYRQKDLAIYERDIIRDFKLLSRTFLNSNYPEDDFEWLYLMQHYGLPTRLLDWSESSLIGLFFAVEKYWVEENATVWVLSPRVFNHLVLEDTNTVPVANSPYLSNHLIKPDDGPIPTRKVEARYPLAMRPTKNSKRILAQRGVFTVHGSKNISLSDFISQKNRFGLQVLYRIDIDKNFKLDILKQLYQAGISHSVLFPELPGISTEILNRYTVFLNN